MNPKGVTVAIIVVSTYVELGENYINMYFDNVGGEISDAVLNHIALFSRTAVCGQIATYNSPTPPMGPRVARTLLTKQSTMQGFIVFNFAHKYEEAISNLSKWIKEGKIVYREDINEGFVSEEAAVSDYNF